MESPSSITERRALLMFDLLFLDFCCEFACSCDHISFVISFMLFPCSISISMYYLKLFVSIIFDT